MKVKELYDHVKSLGCDFFVGIPDSLLNPFLKQLENNGEEVLIATHESLAMGIAVGKMLAGRNACVFTQNSGVGNLVNPITSLCVPYNIYPYIVIGHRHTLPQHEQMARIDELLMQSMGYQAYTIVEE